jgi:CHASE2 domain-containing sensor protein
MSDLEPRSGSRLSRREREQRAYRLVLGSGALGVVAVAGLILAIAGVIGYFIPVVAAVLAVICVMLLRRTLRP